MKKILRSLFYLLLVSAMMFSFAACTGNSADDGETTPTPEPTQEQTPATPTDIPSTPAPTGPDTYRILISSDPHCTDLLDWYGVSHEARMELWIKNVLAEHERQPFDLIIIAGDISLDTHIGETCYTKGYSTSQTFIENYVSQIPSDIPIFILPGNHETMNNEDWIALTGNSRQCTYVLGNNTFIMLDTFANIEGDNVYDPPYTPVDVAYVKEQMDAYPENNVYLVAHHFPLGKNMPEESAEFRELLCDERIIGLFGGHTHLNNPVQYDASCGNKIQVQTGNFSNTNGSFDTSFWGLRDLVITEDSAVTSYIQAACDVTINGEARHYERTVTEVVDFMNPTYFTEYTAADGTVYNKLYSKIDYSFIIAGTTCQYNYAVSNILDCNDHTEWFPAFDDDHQAPAIWGMTEPTAITNYVIVTGYHDLNSIPVSWTLYGGDDFFEMEVIDSRENVTMPATTRTHSQVFTVENPREYLYYQLVITGSNTDSVGSEISELILLAKK